MMYCDRRIAGTEFWCFSEPRDARMYIPDAVRKCVVFVGYALADGTTRVVGTAFLVGRPLDRETTPGFGQVSPSFAYLVTAKHVLDAIEAKGASEVLIRLNSSDGKARWASTQFQHWMYHPTEKNDVDVAVFNANAMEFGKWDHAIFPIAGFATQERIEKDQIGLGDEIVIVGLFASHYGSAKNIPIVRVGNIAAMPEEKVRTSLGGIDAYLVEARSIGGLSGSPAFVNQGLVRVRHGQLQVSSSPMGAQICLLGLMHGHYDEKGTEKVNMGIGIVVPAMKILEVLNQEAIVKVEDQARKRQQEEVMPTMDILPEESKSPQFTRADFELDLRKASRRVAPSQSDSKTK